MSRLDQDDLLLLLSNIGTDDDLLLLVSNIGTDLKSSLSAYLKCTWAWSMGDFALGSLSLTKYSFSA